MDFKAGDRVAYVPIHAKGSLSHPDVEHGSVSSVNPSGTIFVKFDRQVSKLGWEGTTSQGCDETSLVHLS